MGRISLDGFVPLAYIIEMMQLCEYMRKNSLSDGEVAERLGVSRPTVTRWRNGAMLPDWPMARRIQEWSGGNVSPNDWAETHH